MSDMVSNTLLALAYVVIFAFGVLALVLLVLQRRRAEYWKGRSDEWEKMFWRMNKLCDEQNVSAARALDAVDSTRAMLEQYKSQKRDDGYPDFSGGREW